jgi:hypothetical protein
LIGLLVVTGLRISEALGLDNQHVDLVAGVLTIGRTKFGKSRLVPLHPSTTRALKRYVDVRDRIRPRKQTDAFFIGEQGRRLTGSIVRKTYSKLSQQTGLRGPTFIERRLRALLGDDPPHFVGVLLVRQPERRVERRDRGHADGTVQFARHGDLAERSLHRPCARPHVRSRDAVGADDFDRLLGRAARVHVRLEQAADKRVPLRGQQALDVAERRVAWRRGS